MMTKVVHDTDIGAGLEISGGKLNAAATMATDAEVAAAIVAADADENSAEAQAKLRTDFLRRAQQCLTTAALIEISAGSIKFSSDSSQIGPLARILLIGAGEGVDSLSAGHLDINPPAAGTVVRGLGIADTVVDANGFIPVGTYGTLWYKMPPANSGNNATGEWWISGYNGSDYTVPDDFLFICQQQPNIAGGGMFNMFDGRKLFQGKNYTDTGWIDLAPYFGSGVTNYGAPYQTARFRRSGNRVYLEGLVSIATTSPQIIAILPVGFRPLARNLYTASQDSAMSTRVDVLADGQINNVTATTQPWLPLSGISFDLA